MAKPQMQRDMQKDFTFTKENQPNNQQAWSEQQTYSSYNKTRPDYEQAILGDCAIGTEYSLINVVEEVSGEDTVSTDTIFEGPLDNNLSASDFQDAICGEPMKRQMIRIDFTPVEGIDDNEDVLKKCRSFWEFLNGHPEMHHLKVVSEKQHHKHQQPEPLLPLPKEEPIDDAIKDKAKVEKMTAIDWVNKKDIMTNAIATLEQQPYCEQFNEDYCDMRDHEQRDKIAAKKRRNRLANIKPVSSSKVHSSRSGGRSSVPSGHGRRTSLYNVEELVSQMKAWDLQHSRSLDPPHFPQEMVQMTVLKADDVDTGSVSRKMSCCRLSCIPECPSAAENTNSERQ